MSRAVCIPFHRYQPRTTQHYRVWEKALANSIKYYRYDIDKLYLIDDEWEFDKNFLDSLGVDYEIILKKREGHHWVQFKTAIPHIKEDYCLFLDNDVLFWKYGVIDEWFKEAQRGKFVTAWDGSGGLRDQMQSTFPILKEKDATRMGSYYFILNQDQMQLATQVELGPMYYNHTSPHIPELNYKPTDGDWQDSFGILTYKILATNPDTYTIDDDRSSLLYVDGEFVRTPETPKQLGYYHVRNGNHTNYLLASMYGGRQDDYVNSLKITPKTELMRIMAWHAICSGDSLDLAPILDDLGVTFEGWQHYLHAAKEYHAL